MCTGTDLSIEISFNHLEVRRYIYMKLGRFINFSFNQTCYGSHKTRCVSCISHLIRSPETGRLINESYILAGTCTVQWSPESFKLCKVNETQIYCKQHKSLTMAKMQSYYNKTLKFMPRLSKVRQQKKLFKMTWISQTIVVQTR